MKQRKGLILFIVSVMFLFSVGTVGAANYTETFLGTIDDGSFVQLNENWRLEANFNLVSVGDQLKVYDALSGGTVKAIYNPSPDATGFNSATETVTSANLSITLADWDDNWSWWGYYTDQETFTIKAGSNDGGGTLLNYTTNNLSGYNTFTFDLADLGLANISDGKYQTLVLAVSDAFWNNNDFYVKQMNLDVTTRPNSVPEPMTLLLLGLGMLGISGVRKFKN